MTLQKTIFTLASVGTRHTCIDLGISILQESGQREDAARRLGRGSWLKQQAVSP